MSCQDKRKGMPIEWGTQNVYCVSHDLTPEQKEKIERIGNEIAEACSKFCASLEETNRFIEIMAKPNPLSKQPIKRYGKGDRRKNKKNFNQQFRR